MSSDYDRCFYGVQFNPADFYKEPRDSVQPCGIQRDRHRDDLDHPFTGPHANDAGLRALVVELRAKSEIINHGMPYLDEIADKIESALNAPAEAVCPRCEGKGHYETRDSSHVDCMFCGGSGKFTANEVAATENESASTGGE